MAKTHYALCENANESDNNDYWSNTLCGLEYTVSPLSDRIEDVSCIKCLKRYKKPEEKVSTKGNHRSPFGIWS
jgi:hypothetical protein